jgi:transposase-like protein
MSSCRPGKTRPPPEADAQTAQEARLCSQRAWHRQPPSDGAAKRELGLSARPEQGLRKHDRAENSHRAVRRREREMQGFKSAGSAQGFLSMQSPVHNAFVSSEQRRRTNGFRRQQQPEK